MSVHTSASVARLSDRDLLAQVQRLAKSERDVTVALVVHLGELDTRKLYLGEGCASLFAYCVQVLHLSEHAAYARIRAARVARTFPIALARLASGSLNLTTLVLLAPHLTAENHRTLLDAAEHASKRRVEEIVATICRPGPASTPIGAASRSGSSRPSGTSAQAIPGQAAAAPSVAPAPTLFTPHASSSTPATPSVAQPPSSTPATLSVIQGDNRQPHAARLRAVVPIGPGLYRIQFVATAETYDKLRRAQDLLRHQIPNGDVSAVIDRALSVLVLQLEKSKVGATLRPARTGVPNGAHPRHPTRHIPAAVRRAVWRRDAGQCAFTSDTGRRCTEGGRLEFHHVAPHGDGGGATIDNIQLRCRAHNQYESDLYYGPGTSGIRRKDVSVAARGP